MSAQGADPGRPTGPAPAGPARTAGAPGGTGAVRQELGNAAELAALVGFAVVQPVLGPFGESPETFVAVGASASTVVVFALAVALVPLAFLVAVGVASRPLGAGVRSRVQTALVAVLSAMALVALLRPVGGGMPVRMLVAVVAAGAAVALHRRFGPFRMFLRYASFTPVALVMVFLFASPVAPLVRPPAAEIERAAAGDHPPVVLIVLDELPTASLVDRSGAIDPQLVPNLARFAETATWYRNHTTVSAVTSHAIPAILSGVAPRAGPPSMTTPADAAESFFGLLGPTHDVHAVEWLTTLCPATLCDGPGPDLDDPVIGDLLPGGATDRADPLRELVGEARSLWWSQVWAPAPTRGVDFTVLGADGADGQTRPGLEFLAGLDHGDGDRPTFDYLHAPVPHQPWTVLPSGGRHEAPHPAGPDQGLGRWSDDDLGAELGQQARSQHLLQLQWTDRLLGAILDRLEDLDRFDDAVVVVTADHGISFAPGTAVRLAEPGNERDLAWVPLLVKAPGQREAAVVDDNALTVDILPTVADLVGLEVGWEVDGRSLVDGTGARGPEKPMLTGAADGYDDYLRPGIVAVEGDATFTDVTGAGDPAVDDPLRAWRHGRHGNLVGRQATELGTCGTGPTASYRPPAGWAGFRAGATAPGSALPLAHEATVEAGEVVDVAAVVDGVVVGWAPSRPADGGRVDLFLTEPLVTGASSDPVLHEVIDAEDCRLRPLGTR